MKLSRHLRRLRARWRLHRIEWAGMHRPLEPPPGYEKYHTMEAVFPGMRLKTRKIETWGDFKDSMYRAWRLYRHAFIPDPEMQKLEDEFNIETTKRREEAVDRLLKSGERAAAKGVGKAHEVATGLAAEFQDKKPMMERLARDRVSVLREAVSEFAEGYQESVTGARNFWGEIPYDEDITLDDNLPLRYEVDDSSA